MVKLGRHISLHPSHEPGPDQDCLVLIGEDDTELSRYITHSSVGGTSAVGESNYNTLMGGATDWRVTTESPRYVCRRSGIISDRYELDWDSDIDPPDFLGVRYRYGGNEGWVRADDSNLMGMLNSLSDYPCLDEEGVSRIEEDRLQTWWHDFGMGDAALNFGRGDWIGEVEIEDLLNELPDDIFLGAMLDAGAQEFHEGDDCGLIIKDGTFSSLCAALLPRLEALKPDPKATLFNADDEYLWGPFAIALLKVICKVEVKCD